MLEKLNIRRNDYTLGKVLTDKQKQTAQDNAEEKASPGTYKFKDNNLYIVADKATDRVLILYERYEPVSRKKIRELVGALFFDFGDPTVMAHDKTIYWAFDQKGKISEEQYREAKAIKKTAANPGYRKTRQQSQRSWTAATPGKTAVFTILFHQDPY